MKRFLAGKLAALAGMLGLGAKPADTSRIDEKISSFLRVSAHGFNPFPAPRSERFVRRVLYASTIPYRREQAPKCEVNRSPQLWQRHAAKLARRAANHLGWNERRERREAHALGALQ